VYLIDTIQNTTIHDTKCNSTTMILTTKKQVKEKKYEELS
jgi:hypothetical protein